MTAIRIVESPPVVSLSARLALLEAECQDFRRDLSAVIETPFGLAPNIIDQLLTDAEEAHRYAADEDDVPVPAGEEEA